MQENCLLMGTHVTQEEWDTALGRGNSSEFECSPLHLVYSNQFVGSNIEKRLEQQFGCAKLLIHQKVDVNSHKGNLNTPLIEAASDGHPNMELIRLLVDMRAEPVARDTDRWGAVFHWISYNAAMNKEKQHTPCFIASFLLERVDPWSLCVIDSSMMTARQIAMERDEYELQKLYHGKEKEFWEQLFNRIQPEIKTVVLSELVLDYLFVFIQDKYDSEDKGESKMDENE